MTLLNVLAFLLASFALLWAWVAHCRCQRLEERLDDADDPHGLILANLVDGDKHDWTAIFSKLPQRWEDQ